LSGIKASREDIINIWREQVQLPPLSGTEVPQGESVAIGAGQGEMFDLVSTGLLISNQFKMRILVATVGEGHTDWFIKMTGPDDVVREAKPAFVEFLKSLAFSAGTPAPKPPSSRMDMGQPMAAARKPTWQVPADWQEQAPGPMLTAKFLVTADGQQAEVTVSSLAGDGGGALPNVNRWRAQLLLQPISADELLKLTAPVDLAGGKAMMVDLKGTSAKNGAPARLVVVSVPQDDRTWFYKLLGDEAVVEKHKAGFLKFLQSIKYPNAVQ
jgi:hypothetical protein